MYDLLALNSTLFSITPAILKCGGCQDYQGTWFKKAGFGSGGGGGMEVSILIKLETREKQPQWTRATL